MVDYSGRRKTASKIVTTRDYKQFNLACFKQDLEDLQLYHMTGMCNDIDAAWDNWSAGVMDIMNKHAPLRSFKVKTRSNPWMTHEIITLMYWRDHLHKQAAKTKSASIANEYKKTRNKVVSLVRSAKKEYYHKEINQNPGSRGMWKVLRPLLGTKHSSSQLPIQADSFNDYFSSIGPKLNSKFAQGPDTFLWTQPECIHSFTFSEVTEESVVKELRALPSESKIDVLGFDTKLLSAGAEVLAPSVCMLFNLSLKCNKLPADWKRARVTPVYKGKGPSDEPGNYRPISIVSHIAKILEKSVNQQLSSYLTDHELLSCSQSAFRKGHSTATATHKLVDDVLESMNEGLITGACFFDLSKCFDTIDHEILLRKLEKYGIRADEHAWFGDYLTDRQQVVAANGSLSKPKMISTGVPQGSVLGPILFLLFINDMPSCLLNAMINVYADDTEMHAYGSSIEEVTVLLQADVDRIADWFRRNKLTLNLAKSVCMIFTTNTNVASKELHITVNGTRIQQVTSIRYLGIHLDSKLSWGNHTTEVCKTIAPKVGLLKRLKHMLPVESLINVYQSVVQSHIDYCLPVWGYACDVHINKVQRLQNRAARIIKVNYSREIRGIELVGQLGWFNVKERRDYCTALTVFKSINGLSPVYMNDLFTFTRDIIERNTRSAEIGDLYVPTTVKHVYQQSIQYNGAKMWNALPQRVRNSSTLPDFKMSLKKYILDSHAVC